MRILTGKVVSDKMQKTVVVEIVRQVKHKLYGKILKRSNRLKAHNENENVKIGDFVKIAGCRPISKQKHYKVIEKLN